MSIVPWWQALHPSDFGTTVSYSLEDMFDKYSFRFPFFVWARRMLWPWGPSSMSLVWSMFWWRAYMNQSWNPFYLGSRREGLRVLGLVFDYCLRRRHLSSENCTIAITERMLHTWIEICVANDFTQQQFRHFESLKDSGTKSVSLLSCGKELPQVHWCVVGVGASVANDSILSDQLLLLHCSINPLSPRASWMRHQSRSGGYYNRFLDV